MYNHNEMKQHIVCVNRYLTHKFIIVPIKYRGERNAFIFKIKSVANQMFMCSYQVHYVSQKM